MDKFSLIHDALANLYRSSYYFVKGSDSAAHFMLKKAGGRLSLSESIKDIILGKKKIKNEHIAEMVLDEYHRLKLKYKSAVR